MTKFSFSSIFQFWVLLLIYTHTSFGQHDFSNKKHEKADHDFKIQNYAAALKEYSTCYSIDSMQLQCYEKAGISAYRLGKFKTAKDIFTRIEIRDPENYNILNQLASIYEQEENVPKSIKYYRKLTEVFPENPVYLRKLGQLYFKAEDVIEAFKYYSQSYKINPEDVFTVRGMTNILLTKQQYQLADSILHSALIVDKSNISFALLSALSKYKQKAYDTTVTIMEQVIREVDLSNYYNKMLGYSYMQIDSIDQAIYFLQKSLVGEGNPEYAQYYLGNAFEQKGDFPSAIYHFEQAVKAGISKDLDLYHSSLARIYNTKNDLKNAISHYQEAYKYSKDPVILFYLGRVSEIYYKDKNIAVRYYKQYINSAHSNWDYKEYARNRHRQLKEQIHFTK